MYCRYGGHLSNNDERTLSRGCTKLHLSQSKMYSDHLHYENMSQTVINSRDQTVAMELSSPYNAMASDANKYYAMEPSSTFSNAMEPSSTHNAMAPRAPILSNAMEPSSNHQIAMAHGAPIYNAMGLGPNNQNAMGLGPTTNFNAMGLGPNNLSKAITHQASSNAYYYTQPGTMHSCLVGCQISDVSNNGVSNFNSPDQCPESTTYFTQHHQDPPCSETTRYSFSYYSSLSVLISIL